MSSDFPTWERIKNQTDYLKKRTQTKRLDQTYSRNRVIPFIDEVNI
jgi:hypothetical protein